MNEFQTRKINSLNAVEGAESLHIIGETIYGDIIAEDEDGFIYCIDRDGEAYIAEWNSKDYRVL